MTPYISIEAFRAKRRLCEDLGAALRDEQLAGEPGYLYCDDNLWIAFDGPPTPTGLANYGWTIMDNFEARGQVTYLEVLLYEWACNAGYCDDEDQIAINRRLEDEARADRSSGRAPIGHGEVLDDERARNASLERRFWWVASYSDSGLEVDHYWTEAEQKQAIANTLRRFYTGETPLPEDDDEAVIAAYVDDGYDDFHEDLDSLTWGDEAVPTLQ